MKNKQIILAAFLAVYTAIVVLGFLFIPKILKDSDNNTNNFYERSYSYIDYSSEEKAEILHNLDLNLESLAANGFRCSNERYLTPSRWPKELHVIELFFENIYCNVTINIHKEEIDWERQREEFNPAIIYTKVEICGILFDRNKNTLRYDDTERKVMFLFNCSIEPDEILYKEFLLLFLSKENF